MANITQRAHNAPMCKPKDPDQARKLKAARKLFREAVAAQKRHDDQVAKKAKQAEKKRSSS